MLQSSQITSEARIFCQLYKRRKIGKEPKKAVEKKDKLYRKKPKLEAIKILAEDIKKS